MSHGTFDASGTWGPAPTTFVTGATPAGRVRMVDSTLALAATDDIDLEELESFDSVLTLSQSEVDDICDPFVERCVDVQHRGVGRANRGFAPELEVLQ